MSQIVTFKVKVFQQEHPLHPTEVFIKKYDLMSNFDERQVGLFLREEDGTERKLQPISKKSVSG
jgi:hypothetical protein